MELPLFLLTSYLVIPNRNESHLLSFVLDNLKYQSGPFRIKERC